MKINVYGMGYVGCVSAACLANEGHSVTGIDIDPVKVKLINQKKSPIIEPGLEEYIKKAVSSGKLKASQNNIVPADISIISVGTPSNKNGSLQLDQIKRVAEQIGGLLRNTDSYHVVNVRSTVLPGTVEETVIPILEAHSKKRAGEEFGLCMNPEFLREGTSLFDYYNPPITVIGELDPKSGDVIMKIYKTIKNASITRTSIKVAEMVKYTSNSFHALKVTFANEIGSICKMVGVDSHELMDIFCKDTKLNISSYYLKPGFAFGGSCLPKDLRALLYKAKNMDMECPMLDSILRSNSRQLNTAYDLINETGKKKIGILGLSFKPGTDDLRESPMVELAEKLIGKGYTLQIYDREVSLAKLIGSNKKYIEKVIPHISSLLKPSLNEVIKSSQLIIIGKNTEDIKKAVARADGGKIVLDLVRIFSTTQERVANYEGICW
jgi:GDP-mannose 6-dehydrogenase